MKKDEKVITSVEYEDITMDEKEFFYDIVDEIEEEKNSPIIRYEMNALRFPFFSYSKRIAKKNRILTYYFNKEKTEFLKIIPPANDNAPGDLEEKIFLALTLLLKRNEYKNPFYTTPKEIGEIIGVAYKGYAKNITAGLYRLSETNYRFKNIFKPSDANNLRTEGTYSIVKFTAYTRAEVENSILDEITDKSKTIYEISFGEAFYKNIVNTGYLTFDSDEVFKISKGITRKIYTLLEFSRFYNEEYKMSTAVLAAKIPLVWEQKNYSRTINTIKESLEELKELGLVKDYLFDKNGNSKDSYFIFYYDKEVHNSNKKLGFFKDNAEFEKVKDEISKNGYIVKTETEFNTASLNIEAAKIFDILPESSRKFQGLITLIEDTLKANGYHFTEYLANILKRRNEIKKIPFPLKYFKTLLEDKERCKEANEYTKRMLGKQQQEEIKQKQKIEEAQIVEESDKYWDIFLTYSKEEQEEIKQDIITKSGALKSFMKKALAMNNKSTKDVIIDYVKTNDIQPKVVGTPKEESSGVSIEKEYKSISAFGFEIFRTLTELEFKERDVQAIIKILPVFKCYEDELNGFDININFNEENKIGKIEIKRVI